MEQKDEISPANVEGSFNKKLKNSLEQFSALITMSPY